LASIPAAAAIMAAAHGAVDFSWGWWSRFFRGDGGRTSARREDGWPLSRRSSSKRRADPVRCIVLWPPRSAAFSVATPDYPIAVSMHGWDIPNFNSEFPAFAKVSISAGIVFFAVATGPLQNKDAYQVTFSLCLDVLPIDEKPTGKSKYHHNDHYSHPGLHKSSTSRRIVQSGFWLRPYRK
jgi:hypothetical protein